MFRTVRIETLLFLLALLALGNQPCIAGSPVHVFLAGDSTIAEKRQEKRPETGWGEKLQQWFPEASVAVRNHAVNGRSTRTFIEEGRWDALLAEVQTGDYVFIQFGHNDQSVEKVDRYTPPDQYRSNLLRFVNDVRALDAIPVLLTSVVRRRFDENGEFYDVHGLYPDLVREVARESGTALIDLQASSAQQLELLGEVPSRELYLILAPGESENYPRGLNDNTHFSPLGAETMASLVMQAILESDLALARWVVKQPHSIIQDSNIGHSQPGPHQGKGLTTGYPFFEDNHSLDFYFRKRALHPGSSIGYHLHDKDEIYYVLSGQGQLTMNGIASRVVPGTAILTRPGDSHGLSQAGDDDLVILIMYAR